jgi:hypothetical protein
MQGACTFHVERCTGQQRRQVGAMCSQQHSPHNGANGWCKQQNCSADTLGCVDAHHLCGPADERQPLLVTAHFVVLSRARFSHDEAAHPRPHPGTACAQCQDAQCQAAAGLADCRALILLRRLSLTVTHAVHTPAPTTGPYECKQPEWNQAHKRLSCTATPCAEQGSGQAHVTKGEPEDQHAAQPQTRQGV